MIKLHIAGRVTAVASVWMLLLILVLSLPAFGDIPVPGMEEIENSYTIINIGDYPDYVFLSSSGIWGFEYGKVIDSSNGTFNGTGYKLDSIKMHAVPAEKFDSMAFLNDPVAYAKNSSFIITSSIDLPTTTQADEAMGVEAVDIYLRVGFLVKDLLDISMNRVVYHYEDGSVQDDHIWKNGAIPFPKGPRGKR